MAQPSEQSTRESRKTLLNWRVTTEERAHLHKVAAERGTTVSDLVREGLRLQNALPD